MFNQYYAQREKFHDYYKEAEKERIIKKIRESQNGKEIGSGHENDRKSLTNKLGLLFRDARLLSSR